MSKVEVRADVSKNRLYMMIEGFFPAGEVKKEVDRIIRETKKLKPGFTIISDISRFRPTTPQGAEEMKRGQRFFQEAGVGRVIHIVEESAALTEMQLARIRREAGSGHVVETATSVEEAEKMLDRGK